MTARTDSQLLDQYERMIRDGATIGLFISAGRRHIMAARVEISEDVASLIGMRPATEPRASLREILGNLIDDHEFLMDGPTQ